MHNLRNDVSAHDHYMHKLGLREAYSVMYHLDSFRDYGCNCLVMMQKKGINWLVGFFVLAEVQAGCDKYSGMFTTVAETGGGASVCLLGWVLVLVCSMISLQDLIGISIRTNHRN